MYEVVILVVDQVSVVSKIGIGIMMIIVDDVNEYFLDCLISVEVVVSFLFIIGLDVYMVICIDQDLFGLYGNIVYMINVGNINMDFWIELDGWVVFNKLLSDVNY